MVEAGYRISDFFQIVIARHYEEQFGASVVAVGRSPEWDIKFANGTRMEVKLDHAAQHSLRVAIEYWNLKTSRPSGILSTTAELWLHCIFERQGLRCFEMDTKKLLKLCIEEGSTTSGGDYNSSCLKLLPIDKVKRIVNSEFVLNDEFFQQFRKGQ